MRHQLFRLIAPMFFVIVSSVYAAETPVSSPAGSATDVAKTFLQKLDQGEVDEASKLWDAKSVNEKLKTRIEKQASKIKQFGGIKQVDVGTCENRRIQRYQKQTGEKIDVVPVEISCGDGNLLLAVFSIHKVDGQDKIFLLESLKEWGGTASLDEEQQYKG